MYNTNENIYETVYNIVLTCGNIHEQKNFSTNLLNTLSEVCPFDKARIYFYNGNGRVCDQYLIGVDPKWPNAYHEYYSKIQNGRYSVSNGLPESLLPCKVNIKNWEGSETVNNEFYSDYIRPQQIRSSIGFAFFDTMGTMRAMFAMDRTVSAAFSSNDMYLVQLVYPQLNNLYKNFFSKSNCVNKLENVNWQTTSLTQREIDITILLCQGVSPTNISRKLHITVPTVNKHIAHIYSKMQVSNRQELLVRILNH